MKYLPSVISNERLSRYERALSKGHRTSLDDRLNADTEMPSQSDTKVLKQEVAKCLQDGFRLRCVASLVEEKVKCITWQEPFT